MSYTPNGADGYGLGGRQEAGYHTAPAGYGGADGGGVRPPVSFPEALKLFFTNYAVFHGRANRSEFWWVALFLFVVNGILQGLAQVGTQSGMSGLTTVAGFISWAWALATLVPGIAVGFRRFHDTNKSGIHLLLLLIPFVGWIITLALLARKSDPDGAHFDDPNHSVPVSSRVL